MRTSLVLLFVVLAVIATVIKGNGFRPRGTWMRLPERDGDSRHSLYGLLKIRAGAKSKAKKNRSSTTGAKKNKKSLKEVPGNIDDDDDDEVKEAAPLVSTATVVDSPKIDLAQAILKKKENPNMLLVDDSVTDDHSTISVSPAKMQALGLFNGDTVLLRGKKRKSTVAIVHSDDNVVDTKARMTKVVRSNLR